MLNTAISFLEIIENHGFCAYIVGGYVRDYYLGFENNDIDVCTNARPNEIREIFKDKCMPDDDYGSVIVKYKHINFEVTTFRKEISYINNRKPFEYEYINDLEEDLVRRDFTINTLCMNKDREIVDLLNGRNDIEKREINTVGNPVEKFTQDSLRILRAIRFATVLDFKLSSEVKEAIKKTKHLLQNLSMTRKKEELTKIFASIHVRYGVRLLIELGLDEELELNNLKNINVFDDLMGIWALLDVQDIYPFTKNEKTMIKDIREALELNNLDPFTLYKYGLYVNIVAGGIKRIDKKQIAYVYDKLPIKGANEIAITGGDIIEVLNIEPGEYIKDIIKDIEEKIILGKLNNTESELKQYILDNYSTLK